MDYIEILCLVVNRVSLMSNSGSLPEFGLILDIGISICNFTKLYVKSVLGSCV